MPQVALAASGTGERWGWDQRWGNSTISISTPRVRMSAVAWSQLRSFREGVVDRQALDAEPVLHVLAPESRAAAFERGGDDQRIVETERVALLQLQSALVKRRARHDPPERRQDGA